MARCPRDDEDAPEKIQTDGHEALFTRMRIVDCDSERIFEDTNGVAECDPMERAIRAGFRRIPLKCHAAIVCTSVHLSSRSPGRRESGMSPSGHAARRVVSNLRPNSRNTPLRCEANREAWPMAKRLVCITSCR